MDKLFKEQSNIISIDERDSKKSTVVNPKPHNYLPGDIACGKVGNYPWWPCMVCLPPNDENVVTEYTNKLSSVVFVRYFGRENEVSWLNRYSIIDIQSPKTLEEYLTNISNNKKVKSASNKYDDDVNIAWKEVEKASLMTPAERLKEFVVDFTVIKKKLNKNKNSKSRSKSIAKKVEDLPPKKRKERKKNPIKYAFEELDLPFKVLSGRKCCRYCLDKSKITVPCTENCGSTFHVKCVHDMKKHLNKEINEEGKCIECFLNVQICLACNAEIKPDEKKFDCSVSNCNLLYHRSCLENGTLSEMTRKTVLGEMVCPRHMCHRCELIDRNPKFQCSILVSCIMCAATYHSGDWCIPAGCLGVSKTEIICPKHLPHGGHTSYFIPPFVARIASDIQSIICDSNMEKVTETLSFVTKKDKYKHTNVNWCFKCGIDGQLICCETCPAAYHFECANVVTAPDNFYCIDCKSSKYHNYGEIVWIKCGIYRWWPGQIMHYENVPQHMNKVSDTCGKFVVQFFGTHEYLWTTRSRVFSFVEGDKEFNNLREKPKSSFILAFEEAERGCKERDQVWTITSNNGVMKSKRYKQIKINRPFSDLSKVKPLEVLEFPRCDCTYNSNSNCNFGSDCINYQLKYECQGNLCSMKEKCQNQNFVKRNYPKQEVFCSARCGWGLRTKEAIKKHQFVNEYVGEIIDPAEAERRKEWASENNITDFYFMELDINRIIDARVYSNRSRFMNHSCNPNLFAEKWIVLDEERVGLFALRDIEPEEELTFSYNTKSASRLPCYCGAENCSGFLDEQPKQIENKMSKSNNATDKTKVSSTKRKKLVAKRTTTKGKKIDTDAAESISKGSMTTSISTVSLSTTIKPVDKLCYICSEDCNELTDRSCDLELCQKIYHYSCLELPLDHDDQCWFCPCHYCDTCGRYSMYYCTLCTTSICARHFSVDKFRQINPTNDGICNKHD